MPTNPYGLEALWSQGDLIAHATLLILVTMSVASWYVLAVKLVEQAILLRQGRMADHAFWGAASLDDGLAALAGASPYHAIAAAAMDAHRRHEGGLVEAVDRHTWISLCTQRGIGRVVSKLQGGMTVLATVGATAPFVGLFGTVWGIHHALSAIGVSGQASIDKVAGPVGEALIMTAIGLVVAVPAVLGYNWLVRRNKIAVEGVRGFAEDLHTVLLGGRRMDEPGRVERRRPRLLARTA